MNATMTDQLMMENLSLYKSHSLAATSVYTVICAVMFLLLLLLFSYSVRPSLFVVCSSCGILSYYILLDLNELRWLLIYVRFEEGTGTMPPRNTSHWQWQLAQVAIFYTGAINGVYFRELQTNRKSVLRLYVFVMLLLVMLIKTLHILQITPWWVGVLFDPICWAVLISGLSKEVISLRKVLMSLEDTRRNRRVTERLLTTAYITLAGGLLAILGYLVLSFATYRGSMGYLLMDTLIQSGVHIITAGQIYLHFPEYMNNGAGLRGAENGVVPLTSSKPGSKTGVTGRMSSSKGTLNNKSSKGTLNNKSKVAEITPPLASPDTPRPRGVGPPGHHRGMSVRPALKKRERAVF